MTTRRKFLKAGLMTGAAAFMMRKASWAFSTTQPLRKFIQPLPGLGPTGIPVASPNTTKYPGTDFYKLVAGEFTQSFHPDLPESRLWGYADVTAGGSPNHRYLGGVVVAKENRPVRLRVKNKLPNLHPLPVDATLMGADGAHNRITVHLHGGEVPWTSDGGPYTWFGPDGSHGDSFLNGTGTPGEAEYYYPNQQTSRMMWYHDHAIGITRLNAYAGLATAYLIRDDFENLLISSKIIPSNEIPLVIQEKSFVNQADVDGGYTWGKVGDLWYPYLYEGDRWDYGPNVGQVLPPPMPGMPDNSMLPVPSAVPEFFADTAIINGAVYPFVDVEKRHYRFRILNASQARFHNLQLYYAQSNNVNSPLSGEANLLTKGPRMIQIGTEGGFLPFPVALNDPPKQFGIAMDSQGNMDFSTLQKTLLLGPAERADVIIDFSNVPAGAVLVLYSDAPAPFPMGDAGNDYFSGSADNPTSGDAGFGPNTRTLLQFRVKPRVGAADPPSMNLMEQIAVNGSSLFGSLTSALLPVIEKVETKKAVRVRDLTLNEDFDEYGRLIQMLGTNVPFSTDINGNPFYGRPYMADATENTKAGDVEIWRICNLTGDTHPMHFHLVNVQVLSRQPFDAVNYNGTPVFTGPARRPDANELGWKETVRMNPGECTTVIMKFKLPKVPFNVPVSPRTGGYEYVWHCHILEHEEHDMMRPLVVRP